MSYMARKAARRIPKLPQLLQRKVYKTGQTRGADDDEVFQNRVSRKSTVLLQFNRLDVEGKPPEGTDEFEQGFIVLIDPEVYFGTRDIEKVLADKGLKVGVNALVYYQTRAQWREHNPEKLGWQAAQNRTNPLGGEFVARVPGNTSLGGESDKVIEGFNHKGSKGAGIRVYEYADGKTLEHCTLQLEAMYWHCSDSVDVAVQNGMEPGQAELRRTIILEECVKHDLLDHAKLRAVRILNEDNVTVCPLCLEPLSAQGFFSRMEQAEGREVLDLTITQVNLFHINELRVGVFNHRPYNLGWGHHHCNVVVKDSGIDKTLLWMRDVVERNKEAGLFPKE